MPRSGELTPDQEIASIKIQEFQYRKTFGLSKIEMANEPLEDVAMNFKIMNLMERKREKDRAIMEMKQKMNSKK